MLKKDLRKKYMDLRKTLSKDEVLSLSQKIFENFVLQFNVIENQKVHIFFPIEKLNEINTKIFINYFFERNIQVFVPKMVGNKIISIQIKPDTVFLQNSWGILEPESNENESVAFDYVITPLLYCDASGNRIGYGKGFYDQFFAGINHDAKKIGVNYFSPTDSIDDVSLQDVKLDYLVTPTEVLSFGFTSISTK